MKTHRHFAFILWIRRSFLLAAFVTFFYPTLFGAAPKDSLVLKNGNRIDGQIKSLHHGILKIETAYSEKDFEVKWEEIIQIQSVRPFFFQLDDGRRYEGTISSSPVKNTFILSTRKFGTVEVRLENLVKMDEGAEKWNGKWDGRIDLGYNAYKANHQQQFSVGGAASYLTELWYSDFDFSHVRTTQDLAPESTRVSSNVGTRRILLRDWFGLAFLSVLESSEQDLDLRSTVASGIGNNLIWTQAMFFSMSSGLAWTKEEYSASSISRSDSMEAFVLGEFNAFDTGDLSMLVKLGVFPSLTVSDRVRTNINSELKYELPRDLYIKLSYELNHDSKPPENNQKSDYVLMTSIGWEL